MFFTGGLFLLIMFLVSAFGLSKRALFYMLLAFGAIASLDKDVAKFIEFSLRSKKNCKGNNPYNMVVGSHPIVGGKGLRAGSDKFEGFDSFFHGVVSCILLVRRHVAQGHFPYSNGKACPTDCYTIAGFFKKLVPSNENATGKIIERVCAETHTPQDVPIPISQGWTLAKILSRWSVEENGEKARVPAIYNLFCFWYCNLMYPDPFDLKKGTNKIFMFVLIGIIIFAYMAFCHVSLGSVYGYVVGKFKKKPAPHMYRKGSHHA